MQTPVLKIFSLVIAGTLLVTACSTKKKNTVPLDNAVLVRTQSITLSDYASDLSYSGRLTSSSQANLSFKIGGVISRIYVREGDHVRRGQLLATLDLTEINAQVQQAEQGVEKTSRDLSRVKNLFDDTAATLEQYQNVQTSHSVAAESLRMAVFNQRYAQIKASEDGTITKKIMNEGELAAPGSAVLSMNATSNGNWVVRFGVSDKDWAQLKRGDVAAVQIEAYPEESFNGTISKLAEVADPASGTYEIEVKVLPNGKKFAEGLFSSVQLKKSAPQKVFLIPVEALTEANERTGYVYSLNADHKTVTKRKVNIAFVNDDQIAIRSGLEGVSNVITDGVSYLTENAIVKLSR